MPSAGRELRGRRVVVTRAAGDAPALVDRLNALGAEVIALPTIEIEPIPAPDALDAALHAQARFAMLVLGSRHAIDAVAARAAALGLSLELPVACVGARTRAHALAVLPLSGEVIAPAEARAEALFAAIEARFGGALTGQRFLFPRAPEGRETLIERLEAAGAEVDAIDVYRIVPAPPAAPDVLAALEGAHVFTFLSGETLRCFFEVVPEARARALLARAQVAVIGPVARARAEALGVRVDLVPETASIDALVDALVRGPGVAGGVAGATGSVEAAGEGPERL